MFSWEDDKERRVVRCRVLQGGRRNAHYHEDDEVVTTEWFVADNKSGVYMMGVTGCKVEQIEQMDLKPDSDMRHILRYTLLLNGHPIAVKEFASNPAGRLGRLLRESTAPLGPLETKEHKK